LQLGVALLLADLIGVSQFIENVHQMQILNVMRHALPG
jgi:hypothetical protein